MNNEAHDIALNFTHRPARGGGGDRLEKLKTDAEDINVKIVENLVNNIIDQNQSGTIFEYASCFDLHRRIDLEQRCVLLTKLA